MQRKDKKRLLEITKIYECLSKLKDDTSVTNLRKFLNANKLNNVHQEVMVDLKYVVKDDKTKTYNLNCIDLINTSTHIERTVNQYYWGINYRNKLKEINIEI